MKFSIALLRDCDRATMHVALLGEEREEAEVQDLIAKPGSGEILLELAQFDCGDSSIFHAMGCSAGDDGLGSKLEEFAQFCFDLGRNSA